uniref:cyclin-dependent kinase inhibitor 1C-like n=1 Tax=Vespula vulgaris TaxID=7454 RepID=UPI00223A7803|nr:cyclin-dependent kinase inhibitor 1C-like [Vespula vulgaris]
MSPIFQGRKSSQGSPVFAYNELGSIDSAHGHCADRESVAPGKLDGNPASPLLLLQLLKVIAAEVAAAATAPTPAPTPAPAPAPASAPAPAPAPVPALVPTPSLVYILACSPWPRGLPCSPRAVTTVSGFGGVDAGANADGI